MMTAEQFERQKVCCIVMLMAKKWLKQGRITQKDMDKICRYFVEKYRPVIEIF